jgi:hypothetical protein
LFIRSTLFDYVGEFIPFQYVFTGLIRYVSDHGQPRGRLNVTTLLVRRMRGLGGCGSRGGGSVDVHVTIGLRASQPSHRRRCANDGQASSHRRAWHEALGSSDFDFVIQLDNAKMGGLFVYTAQLEKGRFKVT